MTHPRALLAVVAVALAAVLFLAFGRGDAARGEAGGLTLAPDTAPVQGAGTQVAEGGPELNVERSALATEVPSTASEATAAREPATSIGARLAGTVVDARSLPIAGAEVRLLVTDRAALATRSGEDGQFALEDVPPAEVPGLVGTLHAVAPDGRAAARVTPVPTSKVTYVMPPVELVVGSAHSAPVVILVEDEGRPIAGADVELEVGFERALVGLAQTDDDGRASFDGVPLGSLHARAAAGGGDARRIGDVSAPSDHPPGTSLHIALDVARNLTVLVRESKTELPLAGVRVYAERTVMPPRTFFREGDSMVASERAVSGAVATSDAQGRAELRGLPREPLVVYSKPFEPFNTLPQRRVGPDDTEATLEVERTGRRSHVRWPIVAGELPVPPSGTRVRLRVESDWASWARGDWPREGVMVGPELFVEGLPDAHLGLLAMTDDAGIARLFAETGTDLGRETSFRRARKITVRVRDHAGAPLADFVVGAMNQGNNELCEPVFTGADGVAVISGLYGGLADVKVAAAGRTARGGVSVGSVDLEQGDGHLEHTAPEELHATLRILVDGAPCLPPGLMLRQVRVLTRDPVEALVTLSFTLAADDASRDLWVSAPGLTGVKISLTRANASATPAPVDARLTRAGALLVDVLRAQGTKVRLVAERKQDDGSWIDALHSEYEYPNADDGRFRLDPLTPGRYRARDAASGAATEAVVVDPALGDARATLDLTRHGVARGVVIGPEGFSLSAARIIIEGADAPVTEERWQQLPGTPRGSLAVAQNGAFSLPVSLDRPVTLRVWHPVLSPAVEGGTLRLEGPREGLTLRLALGPTCEWSLPAGFVTPRTGLHVIAYHDATRTRLASDHSAEVRDGRARFGGFAPGTYTLWIDLASGFAPLIVTDVALGEGRTDLGAPAFASGSAVRVVLRAKPGASPPRIFMSAFSDERGPDGNSLYNRQLNSRGEAEVILAGLGAGTFQLRISTLDKPELAPMRTITLDGAREEVVEIDL